MELKHFTQGNVIHLGILCAPMLPGLKCSIHGAGRLWDIHTVCPLKLPPQHNPTGYITAIGVVYSDFIFLKLTKNIPRNMF